VKSLFLSGVVCNI